MPLAQDNHFVPQLYLRHFASDDGIINGYRILISRASVPQWKTSHIAATAYQRHLYTRIAAGQESDDTELWLNKEFETPAQAPLQRIVRDERLSKDDYRILSRFVAAQIVRTPAFLANNLPRWLKEAQIEMEEGPKRIRRRLEEARLSGTKPESTSDPNAEYFPMRVTRVPSSDESRLAAFKTELVVGRAYWIFAIRHMLTSTLERLVTHRWTILESPPNLPWFTSDDPVVRLNFTDASKYDFGGGWGSYRTEILLPISPKHLLYTQIGCKPPTRGTTLPPDQARIIRKMIAEHAHRIIYAAGPDPSIEQLRPRYVDEEAVKWEQQQWMKWHEEQSEAEKELSARPCSEGWCPAGNNTRHKPHSNA